MTVQRSYIKARTFPPTTQHTRAKAYTITVAAYGSYYFKIMELSSKIFDQTFGPLACVQRLGEEAESTERVRPRIEWPTSLLNPKNRIDSLTPKLDPGWILHGVDVTGTRFFATPVFAIGKRPMRIDVYIPPTEEHPQDLRDLLHSDAAIYVSGSGAVGLPISQHVLRALEHWSASLPRFERQYFNMPYGSRIAISNIAAKVAHMETQMIASYEVEQAMLSVSELERMWHLGIHNWPEIIDAGELQLRHQISEAISVVTMARHGHQELAFKSIVRDQRNMYNELKVLLTITHHPNVVPRPLYIVVQKSRFGSKHGICGFILTFFPEGSLREHLSDAASRASPSISLETCFRWSAQITAALQSINNSPSGFYPDLKPDNIVLRRRSLADPESLDLVLVDFEQRGGWFSWSPPEISYIEYLELLATQELEPIVQSDAVSLLQLHIPGWHPSHQTNRYKNIDGGFSAAWIALLQRRDQGGLQKDMLEKAQVFMLGKLLWCIFERQPHVRCGLDRELLNENTHPSFRPLAFPEFEKTPEPVRKLIRECTRGAPEWCGRRRALVLQGGKLMPASDLGTGRPTIEKTRTIVLNWWKDELERSKQFVQDVLDEGDQGRGEPGSLLAEAMLRPKLCEVLKVLEDSGKPKMV